MPIKILREFSVFIKFTKNLIESSTTASPSIFHLLTLLGLIIIVQTGCLKESTAPRNPTDFGNGKSYCISTKVLSETPSPDGQLKAVVYQYDDPCARYYMENLSIQSNNQKTFSYIEALGFAIYDGDNLRPQWRGNRDLLVMGDDSFNRNKLLITMKRRFGLEFHEDIKVGQSFSYPVGWFGTMTITFEQEKYQVTSEVLKEVVKPVSKFDYYQKAVISRQVCTLQSTGEVIKYLSVSLSTSYPTAVPYSNSSKPFSQAYCEERSYRNDEIYKTAFDATIDVKWTTDKELLIIGSEPDGEKGIMPKSRTNITVKYEQLKFSDDSSRKAQ